jgi:hypothetical protein
MHLRVAPIRPGVPGRVLGGHVAHRPQTAAASRPQARARDWGRPLALAGLALLLAAVFGRAALRGVTRANGALSSRVYEAIGRALRPARAHLPRWR